MHKDISERDYVYLHEYIAQLPLWRRRELTKKCGKLEGSTYFNQVIYGVNRPKIGGPVMKAIHRYYKQNPMEGKVLTNEGVAEGYEVMKAAILLKKRRKAQGYID